MTAELRGEVLAWNFMAANTSRERLSRILDKLAHLLEAADAQRIGGAQCQAGPNDSLPISG